MEKRKKKPRAVKLKAVKARGWPVRFISVRYN
jgi:hypothetical protein